jgi:hypothetical protein
MGPIRSRESVFSFLKGNYNILMLSLIFLYVFRPYDYGGLYNGTWKLWLVGSILFSIFNARHSRFIRALAVLLATPSALFSWALPFEPTPTISMGISGSTTLFLTLAVVSILKNVIVSARVTIETFRGVISVYFLFAFLFAYLFLFIETLMPGSFLIRGDIIPVFPKETLYFCEMLYFSFGTILTIGFGDIVATQNFSQTAAVIEGILGQLYIVLLVGRLVSVYSLAHDKTPS